ncbi:unnamed protein product [Penicillium olsonii]|nr:unnamed protein product [Penicillium olsonii]
MSPQLHLPMELIRMICEVSDQSTLASLSRVSKALHTVVEDYLWINYEWDGSSRVVKCLQRIIEKPELASLVKHVNIHLPGELEYDEVLESNIVEPLDVPKSAIPSLIASSPAVQDNWKNEIEASDPSAFLALVIALLPNLVSIRVHTRALQELDNLCELFDWVSRPEDKEARMSSVHGGHDPAFPHLREVYITSTDRASVEPGWERTNHAMDLLPLFYLPSLEHITAPIHLQDNFSWGRPTQPNAENIKSLDISMIREANLARVLAATPLLEKLDWNWCSRLDMDPLYPVPIADKHINLQRLSVLLGKLSETLTHLKITGSIRRLATEDGQFEGMFTKLVDDGNLGIFTPLTKLQTFHVPLSFVLGLHDPHKSDPLVLARNLPSNVEYLTISDEKPDPDDAHWLPEEIILVVKAYLSCWKEWTPKLVSLKLEIGSKGADLVAEELADVVVSSGIQFQIEANPFPWDLSDSTDES